MAKKDDRTFILIESYDPFDAQIVSQDTFLWYLANEMNLSKPRPEKFGVEMKSTRGTKDLDPLAGLRLDNKPLETFIEMADIKKTKFSSAVSVGSGVKMFIGVKINRKPKIAENPVMVANRILGKMGDKKKPETFISELTQKVPFEPKKSEKNLKSPKQAISIVEKLTGNELKKNILDYLNWKVKSYETKIIPMERTKMNLKVMVDEALQNNIPEEDIKDMFPEYNKFLSSFIRLRALIKQVKVHVDYFDQIPPEDVKQNFIDAFILLDQIEGNEMLVKNITTLILSFKNGSDVFRGNHLNFLLLGSAGTGKTVIANFIAKAFTMIGILAKGNVISTTKDNFIAGYVGQTASKTLGVMISSLENVLFIDEAYEVSGCVSEKSEGFEKEAITEMIAFLTNFTGICITIAAGYEQKMQECFLAVNEGMPRRFPYQFVLKNYTSEELFKILYASIPDIPDDMAKYIYHVLKVANELPKFGLDVNDGKNKVETLFRFQSGDIKNVAAFLTQLLSQLDSKEDIENLSQSEMKDIVEGAFEMFINNKSEVKKYRHKSGSNFYIDDIFYTVENMNQPKRGIIVIDDEEPEEEQLIRQFESANI